MGLQAAIVEAVVATLEDLGGAPRRLMLLQPDNRWLRAVLLIFSAFFSSSLPHSFFSLLPSTHGANLFQQKTSNNRAISKMAAMAEPTMNQGNARSSKFSPYLFPLSLHFSVT